MISVSVSAPLAVTETSNSLTPMRTSCSCCRFASALRQSGVTPDDTVALMLPNVPAMYEAHFAIPMAGAVIHAINIRLDPDAIAFQLRHSGARVLLTDPEYAATMAAALEQLDDKPLVIDVDDPAFDEGERIGDVEYEDLRKKYSDAHPDVKRAKRKVEIFDKAVKEILP